MKIPVILNGEKQILDARPDEKLLPVLRRQGLLSVKMGCTKGKCGSCTVLLDDNPIPSCIIPVAIIKNASIETLEFFLLTKEGEDIQNGFKQAGVNLCGFCSSARYFQTYELLKKVYRPSAEELEAIRKAAFLSQVSVSDFVCNAVKEYTERKQKEFMHTRFINVEKASPEESEELLTLIENMAEEDHEIMSVHKLLP